MERETDSSLSAQKPSVLLGLLGTLAFAFGAWFFSKRHTPMNEATFRGYRHNNASDEKDGRQYVPPRPVRVVVESLPPPHTPPEEHKREKEKKNRFRWGGL